MTGAHPLLQLVGVSRRFSVGGELIPALADIDLAIGRGEFVAIMGQSGSGKSTLMNVIGCLDRPSSGVFSIEGRDVAGCSPDELAALRRDTFGFVFQRYNLLPSLSALANVEIPAIYAGQPMERRRERARELLERLGLGERTGHVPTQLSGGQQQRVSIARALMNDPAVLLADEPTGALDSKSGEDVLALLKDIHRQGKTIVLITHDEAVAQHAERIVRIRDGRIVEDSATRARAEDSSESASLRSAAGAGLGLAGAIRESARMALHALRAHVLRTAITLLGIVIGVASVIAMLAVGNGSKERVLQQINAMGTNLLSIRPGAPGVRGSGGDVATLTVADADALRLVPNVIGVTPERNGRLSVRVGSLDYMTSIQGAGEDLPRIRDWKVDEGDFFTARDVRSYAPVAVLGKTVAKTLFPASRSPLSQYILIGSIPFEVIGVMRERGASPTGSDQDDVVLVPYSTALVRLFGKSYLNGITVRVERQSQVSETERALRSALLSRHKIEDFTVRNMTSILETATETQNTLTLMLGSVAAISLLVGGIGVMNIMLVSVSERTREIGVRMATGARARDVLLQFNIESAVVGMIGGVLGLGLGFLAGLLLEAFGLSVVFTSGPAILAVGCSIVTGLVFGYLPARKAASLDPVIALAAE